MTICSADLTGVKEKKKKNNQKEKNGYCSKFASPAIKTALIPNTNMDSVKHKQWKLLTNTLALGINHMQAQTNNAQNTNLSNRLRLGKLPKASTQQI